VTTQIRLYLEIAAVVVLLVAFGLYTAHERHVGQQTIEASDAKATAAVKALADAQTKHEQELANQAEQAAAHEQKTVDNYNLTNPVGVIRLCGSNDSGPSVPKAAAVSGGASSTQPRSDPVPAVPASPDIGPGLSELMLDAARLAVIDRECQQR
jgi:hypothetical protein